jgi:hypothetical protein
LQAAQGADRGSGDAVLAGPRLGDDAFFAQALGEQDLTDGVVELVGTGVQEVFALEVDAAAIAANSAWKLGSAMMSR